MLKAYDTVRYDTCCAEAERLLFRWGLVPRSSSPSRNSALSFGPDLSDVLSSFSYDDELRRIMGLPSKPGGRDGFQAEGYFNAGCIQENPTTASPRDQYLQALAPARTVSREDWIRGNLSTASRIWRCLQIPAKARNSSSSSSSVASGFSACNSSRAALSTSSNPPWLVGPTSTCQDGF
jgi:hypothetical protein